MSIIKHFKNESMSEYIDKVVLMGDQPKAPLGVIMTEPIKNDKFVVKDSGERRQFETGAVRDKAVGKGRFDLIPAYPLHRLAKLYEAGAIKYADRNWEKGMPTGQFMDSAFRHLMNYQDGDRSEDHLTAVVWNMFGLIWTQEMVKRGKLPESLLTLPEPKELDGTTQDVPF
jgi:hypothetical protein